MEACTDAASLCEVATTLAPAGTCNVVTGLCECEEGYSGVDDWALYNTCHVNERVQLGLWAFALAMSVISFLYAGFGVRYLFHYWGWSVPLIGAGAFSSVGSSADSDALAGTVENAATPQQSRKMMKRAKRTKWRQRYTIATLLGAMASNAGFAVSLAFNLAARFRYEADAGVQNFGYAVGTSAMLCSCLGTFYIFFLGLPSIRHYGGLFGVNSVLITWPRAVRFNIIARMVAYIVALLLIVWIVPMTIVDKDNVVAIRSKLDNAMVLTFTFFVVDFDVGILVLCRILWRLYSQLLTLSIELGDHSSNNKADAAKFRRARSTIAYLVVNVLVFSTGTPIIYVLLLTNSKVRLHAYISSNVYLLLALLSFPAGIFLLTRRLSGPGKERPASLAVKNETLPVAPADLSTTSGFEASFPPSAST